MRTSRTKIATPTKNVNSKRNVEPSQVQTRRAIPQSKLAVSDSSPEPEIPGIKSPEHIVGANGNQHDYMNSVSSDLARVCSKGSAAIATTNEYDYQNENGAMSLPILSKPRTSRSPSVATILSPTTPLISAMSASSSFSWTRERALEQQIEGLQETLKDTEERLHSLRLQYDNVSEMHRSTRDKNHQMQEEMDRLKIDAKLLHDCADKLRIELQSARKDRADALEVQSVLRRDLERSQTERRRVTEEFESNSRQIMDLQRQCKEMERILARKNPDALQMLLGNGLFEEWLFGFHRIGFMIHLISGAGPKKSNEDQAQIAAARRQLELRIAQLESDAKEQDRKAQLILSNVQSRFSSVQSKYETHISDLETQVLR